MVQDVGRLCGERLDALAHGVAVDGADPPVHYLVAALVRGGDYLVEVGAGDGERGALGAQGVELVPARRVVRPGAAVAVRADGIGSSSARRFESLISCLLLQPISSAMSECVTSPLSCFSPSSRSVFSLVALSIASPLVA